MATDVATDVVEVKDDGGHSADVATGVVDVDNNGGDGADVAAETGGGMDDDGHTRDVAHPGAGNRQLGGQWGADPGCDSPGGTLFPLLLAVLLAVARSIIIIIVEPIICGQISLAWLT